MMNKTRNLDSSSYRYFKCAFSIIGIRSYLLRYLVSIFFSRGWNVPIKEQYSLFSFDYDILLKSKNKHFDYEKQTRWKIFTKLDSTKVTNKKFGIRKRVLCTNSIISLFSFTTWIPYMEMLMVLLVRKTILIMENEPGQKFMRVESGESMHVSVAYITIELYMRNQYK